MTAVLLSSVPLPIHHSQGKTIIIMRDRVMVGGSAVIACMSNADSSCCATREVLLFFSPSNHQQSCVTKSYDKYD